MKFKVGDRVGLNATFDYDSDLLTKGFRFDSDYQNELMFGTISLIKENDVLVEWDPSFKGNDLSYSIKSLKRFCDSEFISLDYLCTEQQLLEEVKLQKEKHRNVEKELKSLFKEMEKTFKKIKKVNTNGKKLRDFDCAYCLTQFIDQAGWSSSSLDC